MHQVPRAIAAAGLVLLGSAAALSQVSPDPPDPGGEPVMSDTRAWCAHLAAEVAALQQSLARPHPQADMLAEQGRRLCGSGHVRLGIMRLRYAFMQLQAR